MYDYACIEMKNVHNATFPLVLRRWYDRRKSRKDENIYNVMRQLVESNFVVFLLFLFCLNRCFTS